MFKTAIINKKISHLNQLCVIYIRHLYHFLNFLEIFLRILNDFYHYWSFYYHFLQMICFYVLPLLFSYSKIIHMYCLTCAKTQLINFYERENQQTSEIFGKNYLNQSHFWKIKCHKLNKCGFRDKLVILQLTLTLKLKLFWKHQFV